MVSIVIDASAALAWCFSDERTPESAALLDYVSVNGAKVPQIWSLEVANALIVGQLRNRITEADASEQLENFNHLPIKIDGLTASMAWPGILSLARQHRLTTYDASYIELALRSQQPLATRDTAMIAAAKKLNVEILQF